jgi:hypothetical protein
VLRRLPMNGARRVGRLALTGQRCRGTSTAPVGPQPGGRGSVKFSGKGSC